jgi:RNA polymerase sigma-70 factor (ECF subfamily)
MEQDVNTLVTKLFRTESGKMGSVLTRLLGFENLSTAEDLVQETLLSALRVWKFKGIPENPTAWLYAVAKRKAIDVIRHGKVQQQSQPDLVKAFSSEWTLTPTVDHFFLSSEIEDSQLRMIFACCHPSIPYESQIALTLKTLCGLSVNEIARCFLASEETITKRLYRAREKIRSENISLDVPVGQQLRDRIEVVLHTLYLLFNEGYNSSHPELLIRHDLCEEAMRLTLLLTSHPLTNLSECNALLSLLCFQASRENARIDNEGQIVLLENQDRAKWNNALIEKGNFYLNAATENGDVTEYHIEAAIAACHSHASDFGTTDWKMILKLYDNLESVNPSSIVKLNKAVALSYGSSAKEGLEFLAMVEGLDSHYLFQSTMADFYSRLGDITNAVHHYDKALDLASSTSERELIRRKRETLSQQVI